MDLINLNSNLFYFKKKANLFFSVDRNIKIGDFGLATSDQEQIKQSNSGKTIEGTPIYVAPEKSGEISNKTDMYTLGIIFFEMLHPFKTKTERSYILKDLRNCIIPSFMFQKYPKYVRKNSNVLKQQQFQKMEIIKKCLSLNWKDRPNIEDILNSLFNKEIEKEEEIKLLKQLLKEKNEEIEKLKIENEKQKIEIENLKKK